MTHLEEALECEETNPEHYSECGCDHLIRIAYLHKVAELEQWEKKHLEEFNQRVKAEKQLEIAKFALEEIEDLEWCGVYDDSGPSDCTPNEKGLLSYVGQVNTLAKEALDKIGGTHENR